MVCMGRYQGNLLMVTRMPPSVKAEKPWGGFDQYIHNLSLYVIYSDEEPPSRCPEFICSRDG
jgi:hypothetical protein